jgi:hypothetical protein
MADLPTNFRTFLLTQTAINKHVGLQIHQAKAPANREPPYIWFGRSGSQAVDVLTPAVGLEPGIQFFNFESVADDLDTAQAIGDAMRALNGYGANLSPPGTFGDTTIQAMFVEEQADDYEYRTIDGDEGFHTCAFAVEIHPN